MELAGLLFWTTRYIIVKCIPSRVQILLTLILSSQIQMNNSLIESTTIANISSGILLFHSRSMTPITWQAAVDDKEQSQHILQQYLPDRPDLNYSFRRRHHNKTLLCKTSELNDRDFIIRNLYKYCY